MNDAYLSNHYPFIAGSLTGALSQRAGLELGLQLYRRRGKYNTVCLLND